MARAASCDCGACPKCAHREAMRQWRAENAKHDQEYKQRYYASRADKLLAMAHDWRARNINHVREYDRKRGHRVYDLTKERARRALGHAVASGDIARQACEICGAEKTDGHHVNYSKPLEVQWLCRKHHGEAHRTVQRISAFGDLE